jgi:uncharacterized protein
MWLVVLAFLVKLVAAFAQAVTGFGFALVAVPLMTLIADPRTAVVGCAVASLALTVVVAARERDYARWRTAGLLLMAAAAGMPAGLLMLYVAPERVLTAVIGVAVVGCAVSSPAISAPPWPPCSAVPGLLAVAGFAATGQLTGPATQVGLAGVPAVALGWWCGNLLFHRLDPRRFQQVVLTALLAAGAAIVARAATG